MILFIQPCNAMRHTRTVLLLLTCCLPLAAAAAPDGVPADAPRTFRVEVTGRGPAMILIPGLASAGAVWDETVAHYRDRYTCHVLTLAGFGGVPPSGADPLLATVRDELAAYIRAHDLGRPVVVGHSLGGFLALGLATSEPDLVGAVVVVDGLPFLPAAQMPNATPERVRPQAEAMRAMMAEQTPAQFRQSQAAALRTMLTDSADVAHVLQTAARSDPATVARATYELMTTDLRADLARLEAPLLVIGTWAGYRPYLERAQVQAIFAQQYDAAPPHRLVLAEEARHFVMYDDLPGLLAEMDAFLPARPAE